MSEDPGAADRERLRRTFDDTAERYHRARPDYPGRLIDDLVRLAGLHPGSHLLEIGCGTGTGADGRQRLLSPTAEAHRRRPGALPVDVRGGAQTCRVGR
jgi:ubiquinone/menaquinone biosynthesis C-methylase UbiE